MARAKHKAGDWVTVYGEPKQVQDIQQRWAGSGGKKEDFALLEISGHQDWVPLWALPPKIPVPKSEPPSPDRIDLASSPEPPSVVSIVAPKVPEPVAPKVPEPSYPTHPTRGWMISELEKNGIAMRGQKIDAKQLVRMLQDLGYDIEKDDDGQEFAPARPKKAHDDQGQLFEVSYEPPKGGDR